MPRHKPLISIQKYVYNWITVFVTSCLTTHTISYVYPNLSCILIYTPLLTRTLLSNPFLYLVLIIPEIYYLDLGEFKPLICTLNIYILCISLLIRQDSCLLLLELETPEIELKIFKFHFLLPNHQSSS